MDRRRLIVAAVAAGMGVGTRLSVAPLAAQAPILGTPSTAMADVWRARAEVTHASAELRRARELGRLAMMSDAELEDRRLAYDRARADWLRTALVALGTGRHVVIERAVKRRRPDGSVLVGVDLAPVVADSLAPPPGDPDEWSDVVRATELRNLVVSLKADAGPNGAAIGRPYERVVPRLALGARGHVEFELLEDVPEVVIVTATGDRSEERRVRLENDTRTGGVSLRAAQFSLEGELGTEVVYDLTLEPSARRAPVVRLGVEGLPTAMRAEFREAGSKTRVVQVRMPEGTVAQRLQLAVTLPSAASPDVRPDSLLHFTVVALADTASAARGGAETRELARLPLELVGRGAGRVELQPATLFLEAAPGDSVSIPVQVRNVGTRALLDVRVATEPPARWDADVRPDRVAPLGAGESRTVRLRTAIPSTAATGEYEVRLGVEGDARTPSTDDRIVRVRVAPRGGAIGTGALLVAFAVVGVGLVAFARRLVYR